MKTVFILTGKEIICKMKTVFNLGKNKKRMQIRKILVEQGFNGRKDIWELRLSIRQNRWHSFWLI